MNRALILLALAALSLGGCSSKTKPADDKIAVSGPAKPNPWSSDGAASAPVDPKPHAKPAKKPAAKGAAAPANPWAKTPPPGSEPAPVAAATAKPKAK